MRTPSLVPSLRLRLPFLAALLALGACVPSLARGDDALPEASIGAVRLAIERFATDLAALERRYAVPMSPERHERLRRFHDDALRRLEAMDFDALDPEARLDWTLFSHHLRSSIDDLARERLRDEEIADLVPFAARIAALEEKRQRVEPVDGAASAAALTDLASEIEAIEKKLAAAIAAAAPSESAAPSQALARRAAQRVDALARVLRRWHDFYAGYDPEFTWWAGKPFGAAHERLEKYAGFLREKVLGQASGEDEPITGDPIGREALLDALESEMIPYSPEELIEIAEEGFAWCEREYRRAAGDLGFGDDWRKALEHVKSLHVRPGEQPRLIKTLAEEAVAFLEERDLVTIPPLCKETWRMEMMSPERQKVNPYFTGGEVISVSFPTDTMSHEDRLMSLRGNNIHFCRATVQHELIPGHHLQLFMAARHRVHRRVFRTPFLVEGWALYWEMLLWDLGFPKSPEDRIGMLFWRSHRSARIVFSLSFHLGKMTAAEAVDYLVDKVGHERRGAEAEVRRSVAGDYGPLYQAAYMLGGLQIRALRREIVDSGKMTLREFHDAILQQNAIPVAAIRAGLLGLPLTRRGLPEWRFAEGE